MPFKDKLLNRIAKKPQTASELKAFFKADKKVSKALFKLQNKGKIEKQQGRYTLSTPQKASEPTLEATIVKHTGRYAFATPSVGGEDVYIKASNLAGALLGDGVLLTTSKREGRISGKVVSIAKYNDKLTGCIVETDDGPALLADGYGGEFIFKLKTSKLTKIETGERVAAMIISRESEIVCEITRHFGDENSAMSAAKSIIYNQGLHTHFNVAVKEDANSIVTEIVADSERLDLRDVPIFTIDGADTKDIDDAVSLVRSKNGWTLGVHIADVSHYVRLGSACEREAFQRQYSFYYPANVIPMLPPELSNGICSLSPNVDRYAFSCIIELSQKGEVIAESFVKSIIRSRFQGVYSEVNELLGGSEDKRIKAKYRGNVTTLKNMQKLATILHEKRKTDGSIDFDLPETCFTLDEEENVTDISAKKRGVSEMIIEEFMLLANTVTASLAKEIGLPIIYRVHEPPNVDRLKLFLSTLTRITKDNIPIDPEKVKSLDISELLQVYSQTPLHDFVDGAVLRSMSKAEYSIRPVGHFGLAMSNYAHFTSPIRRYTDLVNHHILSDFVKKIPTGEILKKYISRSLQTVAQSNAVEQLFLKSERMINDCFRAEAMRSHIGDEFEGIISGVTEYAIFVKLPNTAEGRITIDELCDDYLLFEENYRLYTIDEKKQFCMGDKISVRIVSANVFGGTVDLVPAENAPITYCSPN